MNELFRLYTEERWLCGEGVVIAINLLGEVFSYQVTYEYK